LYSLSAPERTKLALVIVGPPDEPERIVPELLAVCATAAGKARIGHEGASGELTYVMLVSREDQRYHTVWCHDILAASADQALPTAMCGQTDCEPYDARLLIVDGCEACFRLVRQCDHAECVGALRRNLAAIQHDRTTSP
jgi:hypothetical protein